MLKIPDIISDLIITGLKELLRLLEIKTVHIVVSEFLAILPHGLNTVSQTLIVDATVQCMINNTYF